MGPVVFRTLAAQASLRRSFGAGSLPAVGGHARCMHGGMPLRCLLVGSDDDGRTGAQITPWIEQDNGHRKVWALLRGFDNGCVRPSREVIPVGWMQTIHTQAKMATIWPEDVAGLQRAPVGV